MYKITVLFESDINGVYTQEIETAHDEITKNIKYGELLEKWLNKLCSHINFNPSYKDENHINNKYVIDMINLKLDWENKVRKIDRDRTFNINVEKMDENK